MAALRNSLCRIKTHSQKKFELDRRNSEEIQIGHKTGPIRFNNITDLIRRTLHEKKPKSLDSFLSNAFCNCVVQLRVNIVLVIYLYYGYGTWIMGTLIRLRSS